MRSCFSAYARVYVCACVPVTRARSLVCLYLCRLVDTVLSRGRVRVEQGAPIRVHVKVDVRTREEPHGVCTVAGKHCNPVTLRLRGLVAALGGGGEVQAGERGPSGGYLGRKADARVCKPLSVLLALARTRSSHRRGWVASVCEGTLTERCWRDGSRGTLFTECQSVCE